MSQIYDVQLNEDGAEVHIWKYPVAKPLLSDQAVSSLFHSQCDGATLEVPPSQQIQNGMLVPTATISDRAIVGTTGLNEQELGYQTSPHNFQGPLEFLDSTVCFPSHVFMSPPDVTNPCTRYPESYWHNTHQPASVVHSQARGSPDEVTDTGEGTNPSEGYALVINFALSNKILTCSSEQRHLSPGIFL